MVLPAEKSSGRKTIVLLLSETVLVLVIEYPSAVTASARSPRELLLGTS
jgi:hypothetical protein